MSLMSAVSDTEIKAYTAAYEEFFLPKGGPKQLRDFLGTDPALLGVHIVSFQDATLVSLYFPHVLMDGVAAVHLTNSWMLALADRQDEIPTPLGIDVDPLATIEQGQPKPGFLAPWQKAALGWVYFGLRNLPRVLFSSREFRTIVIPAAHMKILRKRALKDLMTERETKEATLPVLSDGDLICAWLSRLCLAHLPKDSKKRAAVVNLVSLRRHAANPSDVVLNNIWDPVSAVMETRFIKNQPIGQVASKIRTATKKAQTPEHLMSFATWWKSSRMGIPPVFASPDMYVMGFSNMAHAKLFDLDFSAALPQGDARQPGASQPVKPVNIQVRVCGVEAFDGSWIIGKDEKGNYWLNCGTRKENWPKIEELLARENVSSKL
ncbi:Transcriptional regulator calD [Cladobotryum mycophilum]|uniref:Transcriptional regulator calD n=1 Tax=Cladobotryum mycophilum TaxID=491253 RepID=A0ABR0SKA4_9HYPO